MANHDTSTNINTYHCICTTLVITTPYDLFSLPQRKEVKDQAYIFPLASQDSNPDEGNTSILQNAISERKSIVIRREDGFEKRCLVRCHRCDLVIGYRLDESHFGGSKTEADNVVYILPGSLVSTADMMEGREPAVPEWVQAI